MKSKNQPFLVMNSKGQAMTEAILLLTISVSLVVALTFQVYKPLNKWLNNYMGAYLQCLLDAGELPTLNDPNPDGICATQFERFSLDRGWVAKDGTNLTGAGTGGDSTARPEVKPTNGTSPQAETQIRRNNSSSRDRNSDPFGASDGGSNKSEPQEVAQLEEGRSTGRSTNLRIIRVGGAPATNPVQNVVGESIGEIRDPVLRAQIEKRKMRSLPIATVEEDNQQRRAQRLVVKPQIRKTAMEESDGSWDFSSYMRIFIMILILVALALFIGGQVASISKGMEK